MSEKIKIYTPIQEAKTVVLAGDICTGSSSLANALADSTQLKKFDVGQLIRRTARVYPEMNGDWQKVVSTYSGKTGRIWEKTVQHILMGDIVEGRLVGLQAEGIEGVLKILCVADEETLIRRYAQREKIDSLPEAEKALNERRTQDDKTLSLGWGLSRKEVFRQELFHYVVNTALGSPAALVPLILELTQIGSKNHASVK